jgi:6-pyruvoyltetrahydropterin/6-carboxytetrahydropterin synthase
MFILSQQFTFDAAHTLKRSVPLEEYTNSTRIHGHTYTAKVSITAGKGASMLESPRDGKHGPIVHDLYFLRQALKQIRKQLDHHFLDEVDGLADPTLENLCVFIANQMQGWPLYSVEISRASGDSCIYVLEP